jgi:hypothetical protein
MSHIWRICRAVLLCSVCLLNWADDPGHHQVLILHSYHQGYSWTANIHAAMMQTLQASEAGIDIRTEYLDWKHYPSQGMLSRHQEMFAAKYREVRLDVVLTADNAALEFALKHRGALFPGVPIVFCGVNGWRSDLYGKQDNLTGIAEQLEAAGTLSLAMKAHPETKRILVICDDTETGREIQRDVDRSLAHLNQLPEIQYLGKGGTQELLQRLIKEPSSTLILVALFGNDSTGRYLDLWELPDMLRRAGLQAPIWGLYEEAMGHGIVGGHLQGGERQGTLAAGLALRILKGELAAAIPVVAVPTVKWVFDDRELRRWQINRSSLPSDSEIRFALPTFFDRYRTWVLGSLLLLVLGFAAAMGWSFVLRRMVKQKTATLSGELAARIRAEQDLGHTVQELQRSLALVKSLSGLVPICGHCKKIRTDQGYWQGVEQFMSEHSEAHFSHGVCPECLGIYYSGWQQP